MTLLTQWAARHGVSHAALAELRVMMGVDTDPAKCTAKAGSEAAVQTAIRLEASRLGVRLWRSNTGALKDASGRVVRFGLCNDSPQMNSVIKGSDLIGVTPVTVTSDMVGSTVGIFTAIEAKKSGWKYTESDKRVAAQHTFGKLVVSMGGIFSFVSDPSQLSEVFRGVIITKFR